MGWDRAMRKGGGELKPNSKTEPPGLSFGQRNVGGVRFWVEVILFGKRTLGLRWWGGAIRQCVRRAELEPQSKTEPLGARFWPKQCGGVHFWIEGIVTNTPLSHSRDLDIWSPDLCDRYGL